MAKAITIFGIVVAIGALAIAGLVFMPGSLVTRWMGEGDPDAVTIAAKAQANRLAADPAFGTPETPENAPADAADVPKMRLLVPAYFYPAGDGMDQWNRLMNVADKVPITVIVNPNNGPDDVADENYGSLIRTAVKKHITVIGYVNTAYGKRASDDVQADIETWLGFYPEISGIFLDAQAQGAEHLEYYTNLRKFVAAKISRGFVITNPGSLCAEVYFSRPATDTACIFEGPEKFDQFRLPAWGIGYSPKSFAALPYGIASPDEMRECVDEAAKGRLGYFFVNDTKLANPWNRLPAYWEAEVDAVHRVNQRQPARIGKGKG